MMCNTACTTTPPILSAVTLNPRLDDYSAPAAALSWEFLSKQARQLETKIETKLTSFSKMGANSSRRTNNATLTGIHSLNDDPALSLIGSEAAELEIYELLKKLAMAVNSMGEYLDRPSTTTSNPSLMHMLQRHRDILYDYTKDFKKTKANIKNARDHADLLTQARDEIRMYNTGSSATDFLLTERDRIDSSHRMTDMVLEQAYATREDLDKQRSMLQSVNRRMGGVIARFPGINNLISKINTCTKRDTFILAGVIATCIVFLLIY
ncbi:Golgi SNAP receptor complex member 1 [Jimgerdemannia flammicorona]|uniref:Golgi SNAP receptor complex member 1 n=1 Tax=Jimgerdemannia flammicorona TaxID=994334 RepID=A0A433QMQ3_9FUNG|nr:Golgi SNAP receptor complex member 1 [Jimgerdemannia flammicorona]